MTLRHWPKPTGEELYRQNGPYDYARAARTGMSDADKLRWIEAELAAVLGNRRDVVKSDAAADNSSGTAWGLANARRR